MAHHEFLRQLGLFAVPRFLTEDECARWRELAAASDAVPATVYQDHQVQLNEEVRKTLTVRVQDPLQVETGRRLEELRPALNAHFGVETDAMDRVHCLVYQPGDFFRLHKDALEEGQSEGEHRMLSRRAVTIVVFLNDPGQVAASYEGGTLSLYGLLSTAAAAEFGFGVDAESGLLLAFRSNTLHEVSPVTQGKRYTLVTWFLAQEPQYRHEHQPDLQTEAPRRG